MKSYNLTTKDKINIAIDYYQSNFNEVVIIAPGWCMTIEI